MRKATVPLTNFVKISMIRVKPSANKYVYTIQYSKYIEYAYVASVY